MVRGSTDPKDRSQPFGDCARRLSFATSDEDVAGLDATTDQQRRQLALRYWRPSFRHSSRRSTTVLHYNHQTLYCRRESHNANEECTSRSGPADS